MFLFLGADDSADLESRDRTRRGRLARHLRPHGPRKTMQRRETGDRVRRLDWDIVERVIRGVVADGNPDPQEIVSAVVDGGRELVEYGLGREFDLGGELS